MRSFAITQFKQGSTVKTVGHGANRLGAQVIVVRDNPDTGLVTVTYRSAFGYNHTVQVPFTWLSQ